MAGDGLTETSRGECLRLPFRALDPSLARPLLKTATHILQQELLSGLGAAAEG